MVDVFECFLISADAYELESYVLQMAGSSAQSYTLNHLAWGTLISSWETDNHVIYDTYIYMHTLCFPLNLRIWANWPQLYHSFEAFFVATNASHCLVLPLCTRQSGLLREALAEPMWQVGDPRCWWRQETEIIIEMSEKSLAYFRIINCMSFFVVWPESAWLHFGWFWVNPPINISKL